LLVAVLTELAAVQKLVQAAAMAVAVGLMPPVALTQEVAAALVDILATAVLGVLAPPVPVLLVLVVVAAAVMLKLLPLLGMAAAAVAAVLLVQPK
jgi:hypothetical protein